MSQRIAKVESLVQQTVAAAMPEVLGPVAANVTVTGVDVSPDLRNATVWLGVVGADTQATLAEVEQLRPQLQSKLAAAMTTKFVPRLHLRLDAGGQYAEHINRLLHDIDPD